MALIAFRLHPNFQFPVLCHADGRAKTFANRAQAQAAASRHGGNVWQSPLSRVFFVRAAETALILTVGRTDETSSTGDPL